MPNGLVEEDKTYIPKHDYSGHNPAEQREKPKREKPVDVILLETAIEQLHQLWDKWSLHHD